MHRKTGPADSRSRRLESWKEIAAYLDRSVRTVRRWESAEKLPVHRHRHAKGNTVFAHTAELDQWRRSRVSAQPKAAKPAESEPEVEAPQRAVAQPLQFRLVAGTAVLALVLALIALLKSVTVDPVDPIEEWIQGIPVEQRLLLEASHHGSRGAHEAALTAYEAVLGTGSLGREAVRAALVSCRSLGAPARCAELVRRAADSSPGDTALLAMASEALSRQPGRMSEALDYAERARASRQRSGESLEPQLASFVELLPAREAWLRGDIARSAAELDRVSIELGELNSDAHDAVADAAGRHCLALGRIECAGRWFAQIEDARLRHEAESYRLFAAGEMEALRAHLSGEVDRSDRPAGPWEYREVETAILLAMAGETAVADAVIDAFVERGGAPGAEEVARGGLSLLAGDPAEAMPRLTAGVAAMADEGRGIHFVGLDMLSRIAEKRGDLSGAIEFLEMTSRQRDNAILRGSGLFWVKCQTRLADVYRQMDRTEEALRVERELLTALALADAGHPTTVALRGRAT